MSNTELWDRVCKTDPKQVKEITGKQYKGNSPKPYYIVRRLTEEFGPCGIGWGITILGERIERLSEHDLLHIANVRLWFVQGDKRGEIEQIGQTMAAYLKSDKSKTVVDEDAPKKSVTDALVKCASYLGFAGDIFAGRWDDSKYIAELKREFAESAGMSEEIQAEWIEHINKSVNAGELKSRVAEAVKAAMEVNDSKAVDKFNAAAAAKVATAKAKAAA